MPMHIIDRRSNPGHKSLENRQRFLRRAKAHVQKAVKDASGKGGVRDVLNGDSITLPIDGVAEPRLHREGGTRDMVLPGNKKFSEGDYLDRGGNSNKKSGGPGEGDGTDGFSFVLTREEYLDLFLDDLELPDLVKKTLTGSEQTKPRRAGYTMTGSPTAMAVPKTVMKGIARRIALRGAIKLKIKELEAELPLCTDEERKLIIQQELERYQERLKRIAFIDPIDIRYRRFEQEPTPIARAVMFCLMDVSGSMSEHMKDLAKRFYMLLYIFLTQRYKQVEIVFIRHTDKAEEVDEQTFFYGPASGGTRVVSVFEEMARIVKDRFNPAEWNIYAAQASDGDDLASDETRLRAFILDTILPLVQYFAYLEVSENETTQHTFMPGAHDSSLWKTYTDLCSEGASIAMRKVSRREDIFPVFHELFFPQKKGSSHAAKTA